MRSISSRVQADLQRKRAHELRWGEKKKSQEELSLTFSLYHGNSRHCIPGVHVGCSSNKGSVSPSRRLKTLSSLLPHHLLLLNLPCFRRVSQPRRTHTRAHTLLCRSLSCTPHLQAPSASSEITRQSVQVFPVPHKAPTVPWSAGLLWYTRNPAQTHTHPHTLPVDLTSPHW